MGAAVEKLTSAQRRALRQAADEGGIERHYTLYRKAGGGMWKSETIQSLMRAGLLVGDGSSMRVVITEAGRTALLGRRTG